jgi:DNA-binding response OmpR family regulator
MATRAQRILLVEDEPGLLNLLRTLLTPDGHDITTCTTGAEAIATLEDHEFDLVITDLGLPGADGWEVARAAKAKRPEVRVAMASGWTGELEDSSDLLARGVDLLVPKPYRIQAIRDAVHKVTTLASVSSEAEAELPKPLRLIETP